METLTLRSGAIESAEFWGKGMLHLKVRYTPGEEDVTRVDHVALVMSDQNRQDLGGIHDLEGRAIDISIAGIHQGSSSKYSCWATIYSANEEDTVVLGSR